MKSYGHFKKQLFLPNHMDISKTTVFT